MVGETDYNHNIERTDAAPLINEEVIAEIIKEVPLQSTVLQLMRKLPNASKKQVRIPVLNSLATAYFVSGEGGDTPGSITGQKKTTKIEWANKYIYIEEVAAIVPVSSQVMDDSDYDIWAEVKPAIVEAISATIDAAILFGTDKPSTWPNGILTDATSKSMTVTETDDLYKDIFGVSGMLDLIRKSGYFPNGFISGMGMESKLDDLRDTMGRPIFDNYKQSENQYTLKGKPLIADSLGNMDAAAASATMIAGAWNKAVYAIRQDMTFDIATEAALFDSSGALQYSLFQQDMVALRCVMRLGWQLPNPVNRIQSTAASRYPFAVLVPAA
jgi:HK97 family phage major capsid protein